MWLPFYEVEILCNACKYLNSVLLSFFIVFKIYKMINMPYNILKILFP